MITQCQGRFERITCKINVVSGIARYASLHVRRSNWYPGDRSNDAARGPASLLCFGFRARLRLDFFGIQSRGPRFAGRSLQGVTFLEFAPAHAYRCVFYKNNLVESSG